MKMKMAALALAGMALATGAQAQGVQLRGGVNLANVSVTNNGRVDDAQQLTSYQAGILFGIPLVKNVLTLQPGVLFSAKGSKIERGTEGQNGYYRQSFNPRYIEVPLNLIVKLPFAGKTGVFVGAGPYAAVGVGGKVKTDGRLAGINYSSERSIKFSDDDPTTFNQEEGTGLGIVRRFDYGLNATAGVEFQTLVLSAGYGLGLAKLQSGTNNGTDNNNKHRVLSLTVGFKL